MKFKITRTQLIVIVALFLVLCDNIAFFKHVTQVYEISILNSGFLLSLGVVLAAIITIFSSLLTARYTLKPLLIALLLIASLSNYFMNTYNVILDDTMIQNAMETNVNESMDLFNLKLLGYFVFLGVFPSCLVYWIPIASVSFKQEVWRKIKSIGIALVIILVMLFAFNRFYTSFFREHKPLRYYTNPTFSLYSAGQYAYNIFYKKEATLKQIGLDAKKIEDGTRKLTIVVVGEAARANRFSLNGYERATNPLLQKEEIINFSNVYSCGTSTAISVPCMFSGLERKNYSDKVAKSRENVIDVLKHSGTSVLWRDNNSDSKGVALRVEYQD